MTMVLKLIFAAILVTMLIVTSWASLHENILKIPSVVTGDPWFVATMFDAYFGFTTFFLWVCYKEKSIVGRIVWFFLIMLLGNMAMATYMLIQLSRLKKDETVRDLLLKAKT